MAGRFAKARKLAVVADRQQHGSVQRLEGLVGRQARVGIALALRHAAGVQKPRRLVGQHRHAHIQQRHVDVLAFAGAMPHLDGRQNGAAGVDAGEHVDQRHPHAHRAAAGLAVRVPGDAHHAAHGLDHEVVTGTLGVGAVLAETGDRAVNQARVDGFEARVIEAVLLQAADLEVLHQHIALCGHFEDQRLAFGLRHVKRDGALVAVAGGEVGGLKRVVSLGILEERRPPVARVVARAGALDLDHIGAQVGQHLGAPGAG